MDLINNDNSNTFNELLIRIINKILSKRNNHKIN